jgi:hypothetical protein
MPFVTFQAVCASRRRGPLYFGLIVSRGRRNLHTGRNYCLNGCAENDALPLRVRDFLVGVVAVDRVPHAGLYVVLQQDQSDGIDRAAASWSRMSMQ